ncbi:HAD-IC family P-type ATPase [Pseudodesulfovibrio cashew]|uniref:HAD-IC family P-type ATPase n=1 Tax=Pseudodesulfovibrio cashew TaxID=2678688 RepID=A0A6I6J7W6_9BACT|nr:cation-transporting P-type ATPase [Pseudodesulfovibrio cashew]QGY38926.1 HAD-IC family P-type ATPase [Pseudodesulfovibrio cashew]
METLLNRFWHHLDVDEVARILDTDGDKGLDVFEVEQRLERFGENVISAKKERTAFERFLLQFHQPLVYILIAAGLVTAYLGEWVDSLVILGVVLVNAMVGYLQEAKAVKALDSLSSSMSVEATVLRAGETVRLSASGIVPGDLVLLRSGDKVPADVRIIAHKELRVDESTLTGESLPVGKGTEPVSSDTVLAERSCMAYAGSLVSSGQGRGLVVATGNKTEIGRISGMIEAADELETPLTRKISRFSHVLLLAILAMAAASFVLGLLRSEPATEMFMAAVALAVGAIPEGLPAAVTIILALGVSRMAGRKAIIRKLPAVETLGGTTVICSDKTGTLTENQMTVQEVNSGGSFYSVSGAGYDSEGEFFPAGEPGADKALAECMRAGLLCNDARVLSKEGRHVVEGDPTEGALIVAARKYGMRQEEENHDLPRVDELPFESEWQYMATLHERDDLRVVYVKGAVEKVIGCCSSAMDALGETVPLDERSVVEAQHAMAAKGLRVLAFARKELDPGEGLVRTDGCAGMVFLGLQGMIDPPREEARRAIAACQDAGIAVKMITGDHALTAEAIGLRLGLRGVDCTIGETCPVLTGREIADLSDAELIERVPGIPVFARVSPEQKLRLVMALQKNGYVCAMTGDGVNDAPALKQADIGIAMGITGTEVAKDAADMILTDDNFATIEAAVEEGRGVFANLVKFIAWTLPTNAGEGLVILAAILFGATLPIIPVQILWINMTTAGCLGMTLAFEPKEPGIMNRPPREPDRPLLDRTILRRIGIVSLLLLVFAFGLFEWEMFNGATLEKARTMAVNVFVSVEAFYLFNARSFRLSPFELGFASNRWVVGGFLIMLLLQLVFTYAPFMHRLFASAPLGIFDWVKIAACGLLAYGIVELDKKRSSSDI